VDMLQTRGQRWSRGGRRASALEELDGRERPHAEKGAPDHEVLRDRAEDGAVLRAGPVVTHDEDAVAGHDLAGQRLDLDARRKVRLVQPASVDEDVAVVRLDTVP